MAKQALKTKHFQIRGLTKWYKKLDALDNAYGYDGRAMIEDINTIAIKVRDTIRGEAPEITGKLKAGIIAHEGPILKDRPTAIVRANYAPSRGPTAPHAHLVERGHITSKGSHTAANPFFRRGVNKSRAWTVRKIKEEIQGRLMKVARRESA